MCIFTPFQAEFSRMRRRSAGLSEFPSSATVVDEEEEEEDRDDGCADISDHRTPSLTNPSEAAPAIIGSSQMRSHSHSNEADDSLALDDDKENELPGQEDDSSQGIVVSPTGPASQHGGLHSQGEDGLEAAQNLCCDGSPDSARASESGSPCNENMTGSDELPANAITQRGEEEEDEAAPSVVADSSLAPDDYDGSISNGNVDETATFLAREDITTGSSSVDADRDATHTNDTDSERGGGLNFDGTSDCDAESNNGQSMAEAAAARCDLDPSQNGNHGLLLDDPDDLADIVMDQIQDGGDTDI